VDTKSIPKTTEGRERLVKIESTSRPGHVHYVTPDLKSCWCEATVEVCRHQRVARIRAAKARMSKAAILQERYRHELMDADERAELRDRILSLGGVA
jgi:hypothetical protein